MENSKNSEEEKVGVSGAGAGEKRDVRDVKIKKQIFLDKKLIKKALRENVVKTKNVARMPEPHYLNKVGVPAIPAILEDLHSNSDIHPQERALYHHEGENEKINILGETTGIAKRENDFNRNATPSNGFIFKPNESINRFLMENPNGDIFLSLSDFQNFITLLQAILNANTTNIRDLSITAQLQIEQLLQNFISTSSKGRKMTTTGVSINKRKILEILGILNEISNHTASWQTNTQIFKELDNLIKYFQTLIGRSGDAFEFINTAEAPTTIATFFHPFNTIKINIKQKKLQDLINLTGSTGVTRLSGSMPLAEVNQKNIHHAPNLIAEDVVGSSGSEFLAEKNPKNSHDLLNLIGAKAEAGLSRSEILTELNKGKFIPEVSIPNEKNLLEFLGQNFKLCDQEKLYEKSSELKGITEEFGKKIIKSVSPILCQKCLVLIVPIEIECQHSIFLCCFKRKVKKLKSNLVLDLLIKRFRQCSCDQCHINFSKETIAKYAQNEFDQEFLQVKHKCKRCKKALPLITHYWTEFPCLDLCINCNIDSLQKNNDRCPYCHLLYTNKEVSETRRASCNSCSKKNCFYIPNLRILENSDIKCIECLSDLHPNSVEQKQFLPVYCSLCYLETSLFTIYTNLCCNKPICLDCNTLVCTNCNQKVTDASTQKKNCCYITKLSNNKKCNSCNPVHK